MGKNKKNQFHEELLTQIEGLLNIEIGNYIYDEGENLSLEPQIEENGGGIDIYILDKDFSCINKYNKIEFEDIFIENVGYIDDISMIGHYHREDLLYLLINFKEEKKKMIKNVDKYIEWKENYLNEKN